MERVPGAVGWCVIGAAACAALTPLEPSLLEEGIALHVAQRLAHGEVLYRDVVVFSGPLPFEALAWLFRLLGESVFVARGAVAVLHGVACAALFALTAAGGGRRLGHAAAAFLASAPALGFPLWSLYFYTTLAAQLSVVAAWAALRATRRPAWALGAGVLVAAVALCKQPVGAALALGLAGVLAGVAPAGRRLRPLAAFVAAGGAVALLVAGGYALHGGLGALVQQTLVLPGAFDETYASPYPNLWPPGRFSGEVRLNQVYYLPFLYGLVRGVTALPGWSVTLTAQILYALPLVAVLATVARRLAGPLPAATWCHTACFAAALTNVVPRADWGHLVFVLPFALAQLLLVGAGRTGRIGTWLAGGLASGAAATAALLTAYFHQVAGPAHFGPRVPLRPVSPTFQADNYPRAIEYVRARTRPGEPVFVPRAEPLLYFATDTRNPTPYPGVIPGFRDEQERVILRALEGVRLVLMSEIDQPLYTFYRDELPRVQEYLERHFAVAPGFTGLESSVLVVLERGPDRGPTGLDLVSRAEAGRRFVIQESGRPTPPAHAPSRLATRHNRRPLALPLGAQGGGIDFELELPAGAVFEAGIGIDVMRGQRLHQHPANGSIELSVGTGATLERVARWPLPPTRGRESWIPVAADLSAWSGRSVRLRLAFVPTFFVEPGRRLAWLGSPRITAPAASGHPPPGPR